MKIEAKLKDLGVELPEVSRPLANYVPFVRSGNLLFLAGHLPVSAGKIAYVGKLGLDLAAETGYDAARLVAVNALATIRSAVGDLDKVLRIVRVAGFVNCVGTFTDQPKVINGASDLLAEVFGERGLHARSAVGVPALPGDAAVEIEFVVEVE